MINCVRSKLVNKPLKDIFKDTNKLQEVLLECKIIKLGKNIKKANLFRKLLKPKMKFWDLEE